MYKISGESQSLLAKGQDPSFHSGQEWRLLLTVNIGGNQILPSAIDLKKEE